MHRLLALLVVFFIAFPTFAESLVEVGFSPGSAEELAIKAINSARHSVYLAAYSFTSKPIAAALLAAHRRGIDVEVVLDKSNATAKYSGETFLIHAGIPVRIDREHAIMHNKYMVIDGHTVETGSFNFTKAAAHTNAENVLVLWDAPALAQQYRADWDTHWGHALPYER